MLKISVITPSYNTADFIEQTIQSVLSQNYPNLEYIVIDGGSDDGTLDILRKYEGKVTWISEKDAGQSDAINKGLRLASGDIVAYINADDVYERDCFRRVADYFERNPAAKWLYGKCRIINENGLETRRPIAAYRSFWQKRYSYNRLLILDFIAQPATFWRRELTEEIGPFDTNARLVMDYDYWLRAGAKHDPGFIDDYLASFRVHNQARSQVNFSGAAREALGVARRYASLKKRGFLIPLQYLSYFSVVLGYSILNLVCRLGAK